MAALQSNPMRGDALLCNVLAQHPLTELVEVSEWVAALELATTHRVAPLFYARLKTLPGVSMPEIVEQPLREQYHYQALQALNRVQQLAEMLARLHEAQIPTIVLKGAFLAEHLYHDVTLRPMSDVDLLVRQADLPRAVAVTQKMGYSLQKSEWGAKHVTLLAGSDSLDGKITAARFPLELHWHILNRADPYLMDIEDLWSRAQPITLSGQPALALSLEDLLLHLCLHASFSHGFRVGLRPFCDIDATIMGYADRLDWAVVVQRAREWGGQRAMFLTLYLTQDLLKTAVPASVLTALQPLDWHESLAITAHQNLFNQTTLPFVSTNFARMWAAKRPLHKAQIMWQSMTLSLEVKAKLDEYMAMGRQYEIGEGGNGRFRRYGEMTWRLLRQDSVAQREIALKTWLAADE